MRYVLDSNVALNWVLRGSDTDKARRLRDDWQQGIYELIAPDVFPIEVAHALARSERRGIITAAQGPIFLAGVLASQPTSMRISLDCGERTPSPLRLASGSTIAFTWRWPSRRHASW